MSKLRTKGSNLELNALYRNKSTTTKPKTSFHLTYRIQTRGYWTQGMGGGKKWRKIGWSKGTNF